MNDRAPVETRTDRPSHASSGESTALSFVLGAPDGFEAVRRTVAHVRGQHVRARIELLLVVPPGGAIDLDDPRIARAIEGIGCVRVIEADRAGSGGAARAAGARAARSPIVAFGEDHCFPDPEWAGALIAAHREECAAVGPTVRNANPGSIVSWADAFIAYGPWLEPGRRRAMEYLPGHNSSYKRDVLVGYGAELDALMEAETVLFWDLRRRGYTLLQAPDAIAAHTNFSVWGSWLRATAVHGRLFAGTRANGWSVARRAAWTAASPLIPIVRFVRTIRGVLDSGTPRALVAKAAPAMIVGLIADAVGQMVGYAAGTGDSHRRAAILETHRERHVRRPDLATMSESPAAGGVSEVIAT